MEIHIVFFNTSFLKSYKLGSFPDLHKCMFVWFFHYIKYFTMNFCNSTCPNIYILYAIKKLNNTFKYYVWNRFLNIFEEYLDSKNIIYGRFMCNYLIIITSKNIFLGLSVLCEYYKWWPYFSQVLTTRIKLVKQ